jgi:hypothetical protein
MSVKINGTIVFESNADGFVHLLNIPSVDANTQVQFVEAIRSQNHTFSIQNSAGSTYATFYGANTDPAP